MTRQILALSATLALSGAGADAATATTTVLDFDPAEACAAACVNGSQIRQTYGDTADVDVSYRRVAGLGDTAQVGSTLFWWGPGFFGDLATAAWGSQTTEIRFELLGAGKTITLDSFDMGRFTGTALTNLKVFDLDWTLLWSVSDQLAPLGSRLSFAPGVSSTNGLILQHGPEAGNRALSNLAFTVADTATGGAIPEPTTWAMLIAGFGLVGGTLRRGRRATFLSAPA